MDEYIRKNGGESQRRQRRRPELAQANADLASIAASELGLHPPDFNGLEAT